MGRGQGGFRTAALIYCHVHDDRARLHVAHHVAGDELGRGGARYQHAADDGIGGQHLFLHRLAGGEDGLHGTAEDALKFLHARGGLFEDRHIRAHADGHRRRMLADHPATDDADARRLHAGYAAEQHAHAITFLLKAVGGRLNGHSPGHLRHGSQKRQGAVIRRDRFVGDADGTGIHQVTGLFGVGGEMQVGEEHLSLAQHPAFGSLRLLHLDDHVRLFEDFAGAVGDLRPGGPVVLVGCADARSGGRLHEHIVAVMHGLAHAGRGHADPVLVRLDLLGNTYQHGRLPLFWSNWTQALHEKTTRT